MGAGISKAIRDDPVPWAFRLAALAGVAFVVVMGSMILLLYLMHDQFTGMHQRFDRLNAAMIGVTGNGKPVGATQQPTIRHSIERLSPSLDTLNHQVRVVKSNTKL